MPTQLKLPVLHLLFFFSGFFGTRNRARVVKYLGYVFGTSAYAISTVLAAFMGGLALGNLWGGKMSRRLARPVRWYGYLEFGVGLYGLAAPWAFSRTSGAGRVDRPPAG